jgi:hypothetical protein
LILGDPIIISGGGGIPCTVKIRTSPNATVTATLGNKTRTVIADSSGMAVFILKEAGVWTVTATDGTKTKSTTVDTTLNRSGEIAFVNTILANNSWEVISTVAKSGKASEFWNIGDEKTFDLAGTIYTARIIGFDHDDVTDATTYGRTKAGITFEMKEIDAGDAVSVTQNYDYNWETGDARLNKIPARFTNLLPNDMRIVIVPVNKTFARSYSNTYVNTTSDDVFLLSEQEVFGVKTNAKVIEGSQYAYYAAGNSKIKYRSGAADEWALRSIAFKDSGWAYSVIVKKDGTVSVDKGASSYLSPAFCV